MGSDQQTQHTAFNESQWHQTPLSSFTNLKDPYYGSNYKLMVNNESKNIQIERYDLFFVHEDEYRDYYATFLWRTHNRYIVGAKYMTPQKKRNFCSSFCGSQLYLERVPIRMFEVSDVSVEEGLHIIYVAAKGFEKLYQKVGFFEVQSDMICFTKEGYTKVWLNRNLSKIYPQQYSKNKPVSFYIKKLIELVENLIDYQQIPAFSSYINFKKSQLSFSELYKLVEKYAYDFDISIPKYLWSIKQFCKKQRKNILTDRQPSTNLKVSKYIFTDRKEDTSLAINSNKSKVEKRLSECYTLRRFTAHNNSNCSLNTTRPPPINFSYQTSTSSLGIHSKREEPPRKVQKLERVKFDRVKTEIVKDEANFIKKKSVYYCNDKQIQIDPVIAEDLSKVIRRNIKKPSKK